MDFMYLMAAPYQRFSVSDLPWQVSCFLDVTTFAGRRLRKVGIERKHS